MTPVNRPSSQWPSRVAVAGFVLSLVAVAALAAGPLGYRSGTLELGTAFTLLRWGAYLGAGAAVLALVGIVLVAWRGRQPGALVLGAAGLVIGAAAYGYPALQLSQARSVPPIHDITTDTDDPPAFVALLPARATAPNGSEYAGEEVAAQQRAAYPDVRPVVLREPSNRTFDMALTAANDLGWDVVAADPDEGRIEATDTTRWFGFKDDVVVRIRATEDGSRVDVRSMSRVGRGDVGANARRIRAFVEKLEPRRP